MLYETLTQSVVGFVVGFSLKEMWGWLMSDTKRYTCIVPGCNQPAAAANYRGLCLRCYGTAKKKIDAGETTWDRLVELGLCEKKESSPFDDAYSRAMEDV